MWTDNQCHFIASQLIMENNSVGNLASNFNSFNINDPSHSNENSAAPSSVQKYLKEWEILFSGDELKWNNLCGSAKSGGLRTSSFRSVCWRMMLGILPPTHPTEWSTKLSKLRADYQVLKKEHFISPREEDTLVNSDHPLSQDTQQSKWHKYFCDNELKAVIKQDVIRTFPGVKFFQDPQIQEYMLNILFCYARKNPEMCYRQGMHEILAPILFVLNFDIESFFSVREIEDLSEIISQLMNPDYLEHDSFCIFSSLMESIEIYYKTFGMGPTPSGYFAPRVAVNSPVNENPVITQLSFIKESILKKVDPDLDSHLTNLLIPFSTFGIRWLRLLFGRELEFRDLLVLWDALFSDGPNFTLINFIVVALLLQIRDELLRCDFTECLALLMQYPHNVTVIELVQLAIDLREASRSERGLCPMFKSAFKNTVSDQNQTETGTRQKENPKTRRAPKMRAPPPPSRKSVIDGIAFNRNKRKNLQDDVTHMQMLLTICKDKLAYYHKVLDAAVLPGNTPARQAVEGLSQLHLLLDDYAIRTDTKPVSQSPAANEIETASEAGEGPSILTGSVAHGNKLSNNKDFYEKELKDLSNYSSTVDEAQQADHRSMSFPTVNPIASR